MRVIELTRNPTTYTCRSYLILGDWNQLSDMNTVVDPGSDDYIINEIEQLSTGCGKVPVEQIILTHNHFDHNAGVMALKERYGCRVYGFAAGPGVDELLYDEQFLKVGEDFGEVLHTPGHSTDSVCLYLPKERVLFCGDTQLRIYNGSGVYTADYLASLEKLADRPIERIYPGHDEPVTSDGSAMIRHTVQLVRNSTIIATGGEFSEIQRDS